MTTVLRINARDLNQSVLQDLKNQFGDSEIEIRAFDVPDEAQIMREDEFWNLIDMLDWSKSLNESIIEPLIENLSLMPVSKIYQFQDILSEKLWNLDTRAHAEAYWPGESDYELSVDDFLYARCAVVAEGRSYYEQIVGHQSMMEKDLAFSPLLRVAPLAYKRKTGKQMGILPAFNIETYSNKQAWQ